MKNYLAIGLMAVVLTTSVFAEGFSVKGGIVLPGKATTKSDVSALVSTMSDSTNYNSSNSIEEDTKPGVILSGEYSTKLGNVLEVGGGISYEPEVNVRSLIAEEEKMGVAWTPIYALGRINFNISNILSYGVVKLGYGIPTFSETTSTYTDKIGGLYYAIGAGAEFGNIIGELAYSVNSASMKSSYSGNPIYSVNSANMKSIYLDPYINSKANIYLTYPKVTLSIGYKF